jgi:hypothetical protein
VSAIVEPTGVDVTIIDRTAQITTPAPTTVVLDEEPTCFRVDARRRTELTAQESGAGQRLDPPVFNGDNLSKGAT